MKRKLTVVIPIFQNESSIEETCRLVSAVLDSFSDSIQYDFVLINDGSSDRSYEIIQLLFRDNPDRYTIVNFTRNFGQAAALLAGYTHATGDCVVSMAADLQDPPELIADMVRAWQQGHKLVVASRDVRNDGVLSDALSTFSWFLFRKFAVPNIPQGGFDFFLMDRDICDYYIKDPEQHIFLQGRLLFFVSEPYVLPYERKKRIHGTSQTKLGRKIKYLIDGFVAFSFMPLRMVTAIGILSFIAALILSCVIAWYVLVYGSRVEGWASLMIMILFLNGVQMLSLGIIGEYLWRNIEETRKRPHYIIKSISKHEPGTK